MKKFNIYIGFALLLLSSCIKEIEFTSDEVTPRIVLNALLRPDSVISVNVSHSLNVLDQADIQALTTASVKLYDGNGNYIEDLVHQGDGDYRSPSLLIPSAGNSYRIEVSHADYASVNANTSVPAAIAPQIIDTATTLIAQENVFRVRFRYQDPAGVKNHYCVRFYQHYMEYLYDNFGNIVDSIDHFDPIWSSTNSIYFDDAGDIFDTKNQLYSRDLVYDGQTVDVDFYIPLWIGNVPEIYIAFSNSSEEYFYFSKSYDLYQSTNGDPFAQPVQIYSNVNGGIGIFAGYFPSVLRVK